LDSCRNEVYPEYVNQTFEFDYQSYHLSEIWYSEVFRTYGQEWRMKVYPHGNGQSPGHLSLFLELLNVSNR
jgi:tripartite motif-containing protein 37